MTNPLQTDQAYELFIYTLAERFPPIHHTTLTFVRRGGGLARVAGKLHFVHTFRIVVGERLVYQRDIEHNRAHRAPAAPGMSFTEPNLPKLIEEVEALIRRKADYYILAK